MLNNQGIGGEFREKMANRLALKLLLSAVPGVCAPWVALPTTYSEVRPPHAARQTRHSAPSPRQRQTSHARQPTRGSSASAGRAMLRREAVPGVATHVAGR